MEGTSKQAELVFGSFEKMKGLVDLDGGRWEEEVQASFSWAVLMALASGPSKNLCPFCDRGSKWGGDWLKVAQIGSMAALAGI